MGLISQIDQIHKKVLRLADDILNFSIRGEIKSSGLFDADWYLLCHPYLVRDGIDPIAHFMRYGRRDLLSPSRKFYTAQYLAHGAASASKMNPLVHYLRHGRPEGLSISEAPPSAADRIASSGLFDGCWYLSTYPEVRASGHPPLLHYLAEGYPAGKSPGPNFDASWYTGRYEDISGIDPLLHYIDHGREEGRAPVRPSRMLALAKETVESVKDLEPELYSVDYFERADHIPIAGGPALHPLSRSFEAILEFVPAPPRAIVFVPRLIRCGSGLAASHAVEALAKTHGPKSVVVVTTDDDGSEAPHLFPSGVTIISLARSDERLSESNRKDVVDLIVRGLQPDVVLNVDSLACWEAYKYYGRRLSNFSRLYAMMFCPSYSEQGRRVAYSELYIPHCLPNLSGVYFDNRSDISNLSSKLEVPGELRRLFVPLYQPAPQRAPSNKGLKKSHRLQVLWAGLFGRQKNMQLLVDIVSNASKFDFHIWGQGEKQFEEMTVELKNRCHNVRVHGSFGRFDELPLPQYDAFLYTSLWDGLPDVLLEAAAAGLPIVASDVGGIGELVDRQTGWLVSSLDDAAPYIEALNAVASGQAEVHAKKRGMARRLEKRHGLDRYLQTLTDEPAKTSGLLAPKFVFG